MVITTTNLLHAKDLYLLAMFTKDEVDGVQKGGLLYKDINGARIRFVVYDGDPHRLRVDIVFNPANQTAVLEAFRFMMWVVQVSEFPMQLFVREEKADKGYLQNTAELLAKGTN